MQLGWLALFYAAYFAFVGLYSPFLGPYLKSIGHSLDVIALSLGMMQLMRIVGPFAWGWLADYTGNRVRWIRVGTFAGFFFAVLAFLNQQSPANLIVLILLLNLSISGLVPMSDSYAMERCAGCTGKYGQVRLYGSLGFVLAVLVFGAVADRFGFESYPVWACAALLLGFVAALKFTPDSARTPSLAESAPLFTGSGFKRLLLPGPMPLFWLAAFFMIFSHGVFYAYFSLYLLEFNYSELSIGGLWAFGVMCEVVFFALQARFFNRFTLNTWLCISFGACTFRFALIAVFPELGWVVVFAQGLHALTFAAHHTATISWLRENLPSNLVVRGQAMYATIAYGLGGSAGTLLGRLAWEFTGPSGAFALASLGGLIALILGWRFTIACRYSGSALLTR
ncbi:MFS transporter [Limnobacter parvus]|uniref:MFS transporter n=1 Tax=Limnobacter parvus TaxID=2939690 RepID=A0ABT1XHR9_9BURK|nr:MFS transporter [Limnobacter parvus]MCR2746817.1 MFS transporter [Limnobacter parvus]